MKHMVSDLEGGLLDYAVALLMFGRDELASVDGSHVVSIGAKARWLIPTGGAPSPAVRLQHNRTPMFTPSRSWELAGPIIESERIGLWFELNEWHASRDIDSSGGPLKWSAQSPLVAAMRAFVSYKLGDAIELP